MLTIDTLTAVYDALKAATAEAFTTGEAAGIARDAFEMSKTALLLAGKLDGKNEAAREAQAREALAPLFTTMQAADQAARVKKHVQEMARLDVELKRAQLRLLELAEAQAA
jgi:hypothetical protein